MGSIFPIFFANFYICIYNSERGQMCAIREVRVVSDAQTSRKYLKATEPGYLFIYLFLANLTLFSFHIFVT